MHCLLYCGVVKRLKHKRLCGFAPARSVFSRLRYQRRGYGFALFIDKIPIKGYFRADITVSVFIRFRDFKAFFDMMKGFGFGGDYILELYENGYENDSQLTAALTELKKLL